MAPQRTSIAHLHRPWRHSWCCYWLAEQFVIRPSPSITQPTVTPAHVRRAMLPPRDEIVLLDVRHEAAPCHGASSVCRRADIIAPEADTRLARKDILVGPRFASATLVQVANVTPPGYDFYLVYRSSHPKPGPQALLTVYPRLPRAGRSNSMQFRSPAMLAKR